MNVFHFERIIMHGIYFLSAFPDAYYTLSLSLFPRPRLIFHSSRKVWGMSERRPLRTDVLKARPELRTPQGTSVYASSSVHAYSSEAESP